MCTCKYRLLRIQFDMYCLVELPLKLCLKRYMQ